MQDDKEIVLEAVKVFGESIKHASDRLRDDKQVVLEAVKNDCWSLYHVSERLKNDIDVISEAISKNGLTLMYASENLQNNIVFLNKLSESSLKGMILNPVEKKWYEERINFLTNIKEKEFMEQTIISSNILPKKIKF